MQEMYKILGVSEGTTKEEIDQAYVKLKEKYQRERFYEGEIGNEAAKNLTKLENAYREIKNSAVYRDNEQGVTDFSTVEQLLKDGKLTQAQTALDEFNDRNAEWHYLQAVIFYKKNWLNESKKQLEIALNMEPKNAKYSEAYTKLKQKMAIGEQQFRSGNTNMGDNTANAQEQRQMGGSSNECMSFCATWCCLDMLCNCCCR